MLHFTLLQQCKTHPQAGLFSPRENKCFLKEKKSCERMHKAMDCTFYKNDLKVRLQVTIKTRIIIFLKEVVSKPYFQNILQTIYIETGREEKDC